MAKSTSQAAKNIEIAVLETIEAASSITAEWHELAVAQAASGGSSPYSYPEVALNWWRSLGKGHLHIITARDAKGQLIGLAPFFSRTRGPVSVLNFLGTGVGAVGSILHLDAGRKADLVAILLEHALSDRRAVLDLQNFRYGSAGINDLRRNHELETRAELQDECPLILLAGCDSVAEFLASPERAGLRKKLAKAERSLTDRDVSYRCATDPAAVMSDWAKIQPLYGRAERDHPRQHFGEGANARFFEPMLRSMAQRGLASIATMWIDGEVAAFDVFLRTGTEMHAVLGRFDPAVAEYSPGQLLLRYGVQNAIEAETTLIDLQLGDDLYKRRWSTGTYDTVHVRSAPARTFTLADGVLKGVDAAFGLRSRMR